jgi:AP-1 complex subunit gamma-1
LSKLFLKIFYSLHSNIKEIIETFGSHLNVDLQQRGIEFSQLFGPYNHLRESLLERMPAMTINKMNGANANGDLDAESPSEKIVMNNISNNSRSNTDTLLDLLAGDDIIMSTPTASVPAAAPVATSNLLDLLGDIDMSAPSVSVMNNNNNLSSPITMSIFDDNENTKIPSDGSIFNINGSGAPPPVSGGNYDLGLDFLSSPTTTTTTSAKTITVFDKNDLLITFANSRQGDSIQVMMTTTNNSMDSIDQYLFQVITYLFTILCNKLNNFLSLRRLQFLKAFNFKCCLHQDL